MRPDRIAPWRAALHSLRPSEREEAIRAELLRRAVAKREASRFDRYRDDPVGFARDVLGVELWSRQAEIAIAVSKHRHVYVRSGQKVGKSIVAACVALWWITTRRTGSVVMTSGNSAQVKRILWRDLKKIYRAANCQRSVGGDLNETPEGGLIFADGRMVIGLTAKDAERIAGFSGDELLIIIDESSGFADDLHEAIEGNLGGGGHELALGNPTKPIGWFIAGFKRTSANHCIHIDSRESPNVVAGRKVVPGLALPEFIEEMLAKYGEGHPVFEVRVGGNPPKVGDLVVIPLAMLEAATTRWSGGTIDGVAVEVAKPNTYEPLVLGVDVARFGSDESAIQGRRGKYAYPCRTVHGFDTVQVAGLVIEYIRQHRRDPSEKPIVNVDGNGVGAGVVDLLRLSPEIERVVDVNAGSSATDETCVRMRDQLWWATRTWISEGGCLPPDEERDEELLAPTYRFDARQRIQVEGKDEIRKRLKRSPDRADALALCVLESLPIVSLVGKSESGRGASHPLAGMGRSAWR